MRLKEMPGFITDGPVGNQLPLNMYWEPDSPTGQPAMISTPGLAALVTMGSGCIRNMLSFNNVLYVISGGALYSWTGTGSATLQSGATVIDTSGTGANQYWASMAINYDDDDDYEIAITDEVNATIYYYLIDSDTYNTVGTPSGIIPTNITYLHTVFVIAEKGGNRVFCSGIDSASSWNVLHYSSKTSKPDRMKAVMAVGQDLWLFGETSTQIHYYTGQTDAFPFALMGGGVLDVGCISAASVAVMEGSVYWLNDRVEVCRSSGYSFEVISPPLLNDLLQESAATAVANVDDAIGYTVLWEGHPWYILTFPTANVTYLFDAAARGAGQRGWVKLASASETARHYGNCSAVFKGDILVGSYTGGAVYQLSDSTYTDNSQNNHRRKYGPTIYPGGEFARVNQVVVHGSFPATGSGYYLKLTAAGSTVSANSLTSPVRWSGMGAAQTIQPYIHYYGSGNCAIYKVMVDIAGGNR
jgi:hypothetical protein